MVTNTKVPKLSMWTQGVKLLSLGSSSGSDKTKPFLERSSGRTKVYENMKVNLQKFTPLPSDNISARFLSTQNHSSGNSLREKPIQPTF